MLIDLSDVAPGDREKVASAVERFRIEAVRETGDTFERAYALLDSYFGPKGELEARDVLAGFVESRGLPYGDGMEGHYRLLVAWDGDELVGVRDLYVDLDLQEGVCIVALSHSYIVPTCRRSGLAALFRAAPVTIARLVASEHPAPAEGPDGPRPPEILLAAEMEPIDPDDIASIIRLIAYGRSGFQAIDPLRLPYSQPDFRELPDGAPWVAIPLMPIVRWLGHEGEAALPPWLAAAFPRLFHACHRQYLPRGRVDPSEVHALRALTRSARPVPLLTLPTGPGDTPHILPLLKDHVHGAYPRLLRGPG
ncbi:MAG: hypothetical protein EXR69_03265 [Myxococcales bacterium]|nr:hypothetical protein [Myxococcales bacterium]